MVGALKMLPEITVGKMRDTDRDYWDVSDRLAVSRRIWNRFDVLNPYAEQVSLGFTTVLIAGDKGWGKSLTAVDIGVLHTEDGFRVLHNMADAGFGFYLEDPRDFYVIAEKGDPPFVIIMDEAHIYASKYAQGSHRNQLLQQTLSMSRKRGIPFYFVSQQENSISYDLRAEIDWLIYPVPPGSTGTRWNPNLNLPKELPPWCYITTWTYGPKPWGTKFYAEAQGHRLRAPVRRIIEKRDPWSVLKASAVYNSFETFDLGAAFPLNAAAMREAVEEGRAISMGGEDTLNASLIEDISGRVMVSVLHVYLNGLLDPRADWVTWEEVAGAAFYGEVQGLTIEQFGEAEYAQGFAHFTGRGAGARLSPANDLPSITKPGIYEQMITNYEARQHTPDLQSRFRRT